MLSSKVNPVDDTGEFGDAMFTEIGSLKLAVGDRFEYLFDYRREVWHVIEVVGIENRHDWNKDNWPLVVEKVGEWHA